MQQKAIFTLLHQVFGEHRNQALYLLQHAVDDYRFFLSASLSELCALDEHIKEDLWKHFLDIRAQFNLERRVDWLKKYGVQVIFFDDEAYPPLLREIYDPPSILYLRGHLHPQKLHMAMVGSRKATGYGLQVAEQLAFELSSKDTTVVSGLARGIDGASHRGALRGSGGTVAVLGTGIDKIYPREHRGLMKEILDHPNGALLTSFPLNADPVGFHFPRRNRIIAGISQGLVVVEAAVKSGALITANLALDTGRDVFAVPGPITSPYSEGCFHLIQDGAKMVVTINDILEEYDPNTFTDFHAELSELPSFSEGEQEILHILADGPKSVEDLALQCSQSTQQIMTHLAMLEIAGVVEQQLGRQYSRKAVR